MLPESAKNKIEQIWLDVISGGVAQPTDVIEQLTYLMFTKQLDEIEADIETSEVLSGRPQEHLYGSSDEEQALRWRNFRKLEARELYRVFSQEVFPYIKNINSDKESSFSRFLAGATFKITEPLALQKVIVGLDDLFEHDIKGLDMQGDLYEHMLAKLNTAGRLGAFRTPKQIRDLMVNMMQPTPDMRICDPACGTAGFLISSAEYIRATYEKTMSEEQWEHYTTSLFTGYDLDEPMCRIACMNLMLHSVTNPRIEKRDSVSKDYSEENRYNLILANPPFKGTLNKENISDKIKAITNTTKSELLFVGLFVQMLKVGGRCACIVPDGVLFGSSNAHKSLRQELVDNQYLEAVISLPSGVFKPYAGVSTAILVFTKTNAGGTDKVWFYDMKADGFSLDDKRLPIAENDIPDIIKRFHNLNEEESRARTEQSFFVPKQEIVDNDYDLSINKYKQIEYVAKEYPSSSELIANIEERYRMMGMQLVTLKDLLDKQIKSCVRKIYRKDTEVMNTNFSYLRDTKEYELFGPACIDAENVLSTSPVMSAVASRKALELCVKWIYSIDNTLGTPREDGLQSLLHNNGFPSLMDYSLWRRFQYVVKNGNISVHTSKVLSKDDAILSLNILFDFVQWIEYCYGEAYTERQFDEKLIPDSNAESKRIEAEYTQVIKDIQKNADKIVDEKDKEIKRLLAMYAELKNAKTAAKKEKTEKRNYSYDGNMCEWKTRKRYIDADLKHNGYEFSQTAKRNCIEAEYPVVGMPNTTGTGFVDYVIWGDTGKIIAVIEAKKTSVSAKMGKNQGEIYANCIQNMQGFRPIIFYTNGFETYLWDDTIAPPRPVSGIFHRRDLDKMIERRYNRKPLKTIKIDENITNRPYQLRAVTKCCENYEKGDRNCLLIMATGTGKTRTAASVVDVLTRGEHITTVLFLADRKALVKQARESFQKFIPNTTTCNLVIDKRERNARFVFSTYPTILHAIDSELNEDGSRFFSPGHFDLIIVDEAHRSIFNKYRAIFEYFDACKLGLTATPKKTVHQSTYEFFKMKNNMPTDVYEYNEAVEKDHVLVPFYPIETATKISEEGLNPEDMTEQEREYFDDEFTEEGVTPERIPPAKINKYIFNMDTADKMISDLMNNGIRHKNGNHVGKSIIFAQTKKHAEFLIERFDELYKEYKGAFCKLVICDEPYAEKNLEDFKKADSMPFIAITVDMLETGIDVPEIVNLVFAKKVYSRIKFDQMIGRGTRLCDNLFGEGQHKTEFYIFDYMRNFQFFDEHPRGKEAGVTMSPVAEIFARKVRIIKALQNAEYAADEYQAFRETLVADVLDSIRALNPERIEVKLELRYVEKFKDEKSFVMLSDADKTDIIEHLATLISSYETDENAIHFDNSMYGMMVSVLEANNNFGRIKNHIQRNATLLLSECATIPEVKAKIPRLQEIEKEAIWEKRDILVYEDIRNDLRDIMKYLPSHEIRIHYVDFEDEFVDRVEGRKIDMGNSDFDDYRKKVNEYVETHKQHPAIKKLLRNEPISEEDYKELERIFTKELGTKEEYEVNYKDTPFGILIRKIAKMDRDAAYAAFASFIAEERPNAEQIHFINQVVDYIVENGYVKDVLDLMKAPFDRPYKFSMIFSRDEQIKFVSVINAFKSNAMVA